MLLKPEYAHLLKKNARINANKVSGNETSHPSLFADANRSLVKCFQTVKLFPCAVEMSAIGLHLFCCVQMHATQSLSQKKDGRERGERNAFIIVIT